MDQDLALLTLAAKCGALQYGDATDTDADRVVRLLEEILKGSDYA